MTKGGRSLLIDIGSSKIILAGANTIHFSINHQAEEGTDLLKREAWEKEDL